VLKVNPYLYTEQILPVLKSPEEKEK